MIQSIVYKTDVRPGEDELAGLYKGVGWDMADSPAHLHKAVSESGWVASAWHEERLVGLARVLTDGVYVAFFQEIVVHPDFQHQGVGKELLDLYDESFGNYPSQVAVTDLEWARGKLEKRGFRAETGALSRSRPLIGMGMKDI